MSLTDSRWNHIKDFFKKADTDGNGLLSKAEFKIGVMSSCGVGEEEAEAIVVWVSKLLFFFALIAAGVFYRFSEQYAIQSWNALDADESESLSIEELIQWSELVK